MFQMTPDTESLIDRALNEDLYLGDPTTDALIPPDMAGAAEFVVKAEGVLAGIDVALAVFRRLDPELRTRKLLEDGSLLHSGDVIGTIVGSVASILKAERTALNFLRRMSGIATETSRYVHAVQGYKVRIVDTRKTTPGLRALEKYAVRMGGGHNHRWNLGDGILIKDNHIEAMRSRGMTLGQTIQQAQARASHTINVEVEVETLEEVREALEAGAKILLLDNMDLESMALAVRAAQGKAILEASGNITLDTVRAVAATGVDIISVGALTHSSKSLDISLDLKRA